MRIFRSLVPVALLMLSGVGWGQADSNGNTNPTTTQNLPVKEKSSLGVDAGTEMSGHSAGLQVDTTAGAQSLRISRPDPETNLPGAAEANQARLRNLARQKQLVDDTAKLVALANELKAEVDKSTKDTLSLDVINKASEIEKLAHEVKEKMKCSGCGSGPGLMP